MLTPIPDLPEGLAGLHASGTVTGGDLPGALAGLGPARALLVTVDPDFDGYMVELLRGLERALAGGPLARCALVMPETMLPEARLHGEIAGCHAFSTAERRLAETWALD